VISTLKGLFAPGAQVRQLLVMALVTLLTAFLLTDFSWRIMPEYEEGAIPDRDIVAPVPFSFVDTTATYEAQVAAETRVPPVFRLDQGAARGLGEQVSAAFTAARLRLPQEPLQPEALDPAILRDFEDTVGYSLAVADQLLLIEDGFSEDTEALTLELLEVATRLPIIEDRHELPTADSSGITLLSVLGGLQEESLITDFAKLRSLEEAWQAIGIYVVERLATVQDPGRVKLAAALAKGVLRANCSYDEAETSRRRLAARAATDPIEVSVPKGKRIVRLGDPVTATQARELTALRETTRQSGAGGTFFTHLAFGGIVIASAWHFARTTIRKFAPRPQDAEAMAFTLVLVLGVARLLANAATSLEASGAIAPGLLALLVPVAGGTMLIRILVNSESALILAVVGSVLSAAIHDRSAYLVAWYLVTSVVASASVGQGRERAAVLKAGLQAALIGTGLTVLLLLARQGGPDADTLALTVERVVTVAAASMAAGALNAVLALGLVPAFELLGFVTDYRLLELANLNHPLLRQLMLRAPGTYHHSVIVGSLSEAACEAIGANALLARVACYFHDIGKGVKPQYFVENQREGNRHDRMSPEQSAQVIINHVRDGHLLALQYQLPKPIIDNIFMHHGTGIIQYFYNKAKEQAPEGTVVDDNLFRYPGPKPDSREAGIIMLADKIEAACRTIQSPGEVRIRAMIQQIINSVMSDGQLENCPLTLKELYQIGDTFTMVLLGIYHHRIEYPDTKAIASGKGKFVPVPKQGTITLEIVNPLKPPPVGAPASESKDYERVESLPGSGNATLPSVDDS
jgi:putative nucleotidyltransferase with HDIG domain